MKKTIIAIVALGAMTLGAADIGRVIVRQQ